PRPRGRRDRQQRRRKRAGSARGRTAPAVPGTGNRVGRATPTDLVRRSGGRGPSPRIAGEGGHRPPTLAATPDNIHGRAPTLPTHAGRLASCTCRTIDEPGSTAPPGSSP